MGNEEREKDFHETWKHNSCELRSKPLGWSIGSILAMLIGNKLIDNLDAKG